MLAATEEFTESGFIKKLQRLNNSSLSIQSLSEWAIYHKKHYSTVVKLWVREIIKAPEHRRITLMYLANDVIQSSRKVGREYSYEFGRDMEKVCQYMSNSEEKTKNEIERLLSIWLERKIYNDLQIGLFQRALVMGFKDPFAIVRAKSTKQSEERVPNVEILENQVHPQAPPRSDKIIEAIQGFQFNLMSNSVQNLTEKLENSTKNIPDVSTIAEIHDTDVAEQLAAEIDNAVTTVSQYKSSFAAEVRQREMLVDMMKRFLQAQEELITQGRNSIEECQEKLTNMYTVWQGLQDHKQSLPDVTLIPDDAVEIFLQS